MLFKDASYVETTNELLKLIESNSNTAMMIGDKIRKIKINSTTKEDISEKIIIKSDCRDKEVQNEDVDEYNYYLEFLKTLEEGFSEKEIIAVLPGCDDYHYKDIIIRMQAEIVKEMKEINDFINEERAGLSLEELDEFKKSLENEKRKKAVLASLLVDRKEDKVSEKITNKLVLVPTASGNIRIIDELESFPAEFYQRFLELVNSIVDGSFKGFKRFTSHNSLIGVCEVRGYQTRIVFSRIGKDTYALITAFIKKDDNSKNYRESLGNKIGEFRAIESALKEKINDEEFMETNDFYVQELFNLLEEKTKAKKYKKGGLND